MKLYEISRDFSELFEVLESVSEWEPTIVDGIAVDDDGEVVEDVNAYRDLWTDGCLEKLMELECDFEIKAENIACYIKSLDGEIEMLEKEKRNISARLKAKNNLVDRLKTLLIESMQEIGRTKIDRPKARISLRKNAESAQFISEKAFIRWAGENRQDLLRYKPEINKTEVKNALQNGEDIPGATLNRTTSAVIK